MIDYNRPAPQDQPKAFPRGQGIPEFKKIVVLNNFIYNFKSIILSNTDELSFIDESFYSVLALKIEINCGKRKKNYKFIFRIMCKKNETLVAEGINASSSPRFISSFC